MLPVVAIHQLVGNPASPPMLGQVWSLAVVANSALWGLCAGTTVQLLAVRRGRREWECAVSQLVSRADLDPNAAVLVGTYATPAMALAIMDALLSEGIAVAPVTNGREGPFPRLDLLSNGIGLFAAPETEVSAREIVRAIEDPGFHK